MSAWTNKYIQMATEETLDGSCLTGLKPTDVVKQKKTNLSGLSL